MGIVLLLILVSQQTENFAARHCVKNIGGMFINKIIHDFKQVAAGVKPWALKHPPNGFNRPAGHGGRRFPEGKLL